MNNPSNLKSLKKPKRIYVKHEYVPTVGDKIDNFLHSETAAATTTKFLLAFLGMGAIVFGGALVPGVLKALGSYDSSWGDIGKDERARKRINNALGNLKRQKFIKITKEKNGSFQVKLTDSGKQRLLKLSMENIVLPNPAVWDGKWRIVIFDIPNELNAAREALREKIKGLGFKQLQRSVWVYPYECKDEILFVAEFFGVEKYVEIIVAEKVLHEKVLRDAFKMK